MEVQRKSDVLQKQRALLHLQHYRGVFSFLQRVNLKLYSIAYVLSPAVTNLERSALNTDERTFLYTRNCRLTYICQEL